MEYYFEGTTPLEDELFKRLAEIKELINEHRDDHLNLLKEVLEIIERPIPLPLPEY